MELAQALAHERRARLAAERLLQQKQDELGVANRELSRHARQLSVEVIEKREEVDTVRTDLKAAESKAVQAQKRLWTSLSTLPDGLALFDADSRLVMANSAWLQPFDGLSAIVPGAAYGDILRLAIEEGMIDLGGETRESFHARLMTRWSSDRIPPMVLKLWNGSSVRLVDRRGEDGDMISLAIDISAQMRNEERLRDARIRAEAANRAKSAFLANMSHELRTPMNGVVAMADLLAETALDEDQRSFVDTIRTSGEALLVIINDILDLSKIDARRLQLHLDDFDLEQAVHEVVQLVRPLVQGKALELRIDYDLFLPTRFRGDQGRVRQILTNLIGNAVKFTEKGHVTVRVTGVAQAGSWAVHVAVEDTGIGIAPEMQKHVFGEFNQAEDARNRRFEGTGLGLAITDRLVRMMGGDIWLDSQPGVGSVFGFRIPLPEAADAALPLQPRRVLVVEPDAASASMLEAQLSTLGMTVRCLPDARTALAQRTRTADLVIAAARMPDLTPRELADSLADQGRSCPVLVICDHQADPTGLPSLTRPLSRESLRLALQQVQPAPAPVESVAPDAPAPAALRRMRVLAAEDNKTNQLVLQKMLRDLPIELCFANNGIEAVMRHTDWSPDLIFMDISMPVIDGKEATRRIRAAEDGTGRRTPIVALTAHALSGDEAEILSAGLDHYLTKPLRKAALVERIRAACPPGVHPPVPEKDGEAAGEPAAEATDPDRGCLPDPVPAVAEIEPRLTFQSRRRISAAE